MLSWITERDVSTEKKLGLDYYCSALRLAMLYWAVHMSVHFVGSFVRDPLVFSGQEPMMESLRVRNGYGYGNCR